jgi:hypothetical protein
LPNVQPPHDTCNKKFPFSKSNLETKNLIENLTYLEGDFADVELPGNRVLPPQPEGSGGCSRGATTQSTKILGTPTFFT